MSQSREASEASVSGAAGGCTPCSGMIMSLFSKEDSDHAPRSEISIGSPPVIEDPVIKQLFGDTNLDNKSDYDMIERMLRGEKLISPEALTALSPIDVQAITKDADRIMKNVQSRRRSDVGNVMVPVHRGRSGSMSSPSQRGPRSRRGSRSSSLPNITRPSVVKKGAGKGKKGKEKALDKKKHRKVENKCVGTETSPPKPPPKPPVKLLPACSLCEHNAYTENIGFSPCAAYGDFMVNYCHSDVSKVKKTSSAPWNGQDGGPTGDSPSSKSLPTKNVVKRSYRKKSGREGEKRRTSVCVEETATSEAVELLGGNSSRPADTGLPQSTPAAYAPTGPRAS
ncbi:hypothetical protein V5799_026208, partial [Amblyomma americanum]